MQLPSNVYNILKWLTLIFIPALATTLFTILNLFGVSSETIQIVIGTIGALNTLLGVAIGVSTQQYNNSEEKFDGEVHITETPPNVDNIIQHIDFSKTAEDLTDKGEVLLKVKKLPPAA